MPQQAPAIQADIEKMTKADPHFTVERQRARQQLLGLHAGAAQTFIEESEFVSLGCFCGISSALGATGMRKSAYPFDWVRSPVEGIIQCFDSGFADFLTFSSYRVEGQHEGFLSSRWGGSFWHHKPYDLKVREEFNRRIERMLGLGNVSPMKTRVFARAVNSTRELDAIHALYQSLQRALPQANVYLIVLIDMQDVKGPLRVKGESEHVLFYRIHKGMWDPSNTADIHKVDGPYSEALAFAVHYWTGLERCKAEVTEFDNISELSSFCQQFDGGSAATELFAPKPISSTRISLRRQLDPPREACTKQSLHVALPDWSSNAGSSKLAPPPNPNKSCELLTPDLRQTPEILPLGGLFNDLVSHISKEVDEAMQSLSSPGWRRPK